MNNSHQRSQTLLQKLYCDLGEILARTAHGERLPSEPDLAVQLGVSRATLREAISMYENQGLIQRRHGVGTFVVHPEQVIESGLEVLNTIEEVASRNNLAMRTAQLTIFNRPAEEDESERLKLSPGTKIMQVTRIMEVKGRPVAYMIDVLPENLIDPQKLSEEYHGSVLDMLMSRERLLSTSYTEIRPVLATAKVARALGIKTGDTVLRFISTVFNFNSKVVYLSDDTFLLSDFRFHVLRRIERFPR